MGKTWFARIAIIMVLIIVVICLMIFEFFAVQKYAMDDLTYETVLNSRKQLLRGHVNRVIDDISVLQEDTLEQNQLYVEVIANEIHIGLEALGISGSEEEDRINTIINIIEDHVNLQNGLHGLLNISVFNMDNNQIIYMTGEHDTLVKYNESYESADVNHHLEHNNLSVNVYLRNDDLESMTKEKIKNWIRNLRVEGSDYLWINEVINYEGGHDYGIRLVHPNLPDTEGVFLSTETEDIKGNKPYKTELQGINEKGEIYFNYFFKEFESDNISEKMTYAKLYEPYDWIIATGIYMSDIDDLKKAYEISEDRFVTSRVILFMSFVVLVLLITAAILVLLRFSKDLRIRERQSRQHNDELTNKLSEVERIALSDTLIMGLNRRGLLTRLDEEIARFKRHDYSLAIVMADIDHFKSVNDTYGHDVGDRALVHLSDVIHSNLRQEDIIGRLGGDEFIIIMPYTDAEEAVGVARKIQEALTKEGLQHENYEISMTISLGITEAKLTDHSEEVLKRTDIAMYQSKRSGRNRISVFKGDE